MGDVDVIIIGAGAAGLAAGMELVRNGKKVQVLEARSRIGGRIFTVDENRFHQPFERGAEFVHGQLPVTLQLLKEASIPFYKIGGTSYRIKAGKLSESDAFIKDWDVLLRELKKLKVDVSIAQFLEENFSEAKYKELKESVLQFVQGYDAADAKKASAFALRDEWETEDEEHQYRIEGGYIQLMDYLKNEIEKGDGRLHLSQVVQSVHWQKNKVEALTESGYKFTASKILITVPLGVLQSKKSAGHLSFFPQLQGQANAAEKMGFGAVLKINIQFRNRFWETELEHKWKDVEFIFSDAAIPTWWSQLPAHVATLTGWLAGPAAVALKDVEESVIHKKVLESLAYIFSVDEQFVQDRIESLVITNWAADDFACGAYSYSTLDTSWARNILSQPVEDTIYFGGEALYEGKEAGTVEGALANGFHVAKKIISSTF